MTEICHIVIFPRVGCVDTHHIIKVAYEKIYAERPKQKVRDYAPYAKQEWVLDVLNVVSLPSRGVKKRIIMYMLEGGFEHFENVFVLFL